MISADFEIRKQLLKANASLKATLKGCMETVSKTYFKYMYSNSALSELAKNVIDGLNRELKELTNESRPDTANQGLLIQYP